MEYLSHVNGDSVAECGTVVWNLETLVLGIKFADQIVIGGFLPSGFNNGSVSCINVRPNQFCKSTDLFIC
jgi:hypothetical protein